MSIPSRITKALDEVSAVYEIHSLPDSENAKQQAKQLGDESKYLVRAIGLTSDGQTYLAVLPYHYLLDYRSLTEYLGFEPEIMSQEQLDKIFKGCAEGCCSPVEGAYDIQIIAETSLLDMPKVYLQSGDPQQLLVLDKVAANLVYQNCRSTDFGVSPERLNAGRNNEEKDGKAVDLSFTPMRLKQRVDETFDLPAMPDIAQDIMKLRVDPSADAGKLGAIVSRDPSLAAQVISWASSPYYGYQGKVDSIETAIARVLGFELVMNLALGISIGKSLKVPKEGPLGVERFWKQAIYSANLAEKLCRAMPIKQRPERGLIYLSGLLHNFGHLLLGHIFPPQFKLINRSIEANPHICVEDIEFYVLGVSHEEIGAWLMQNWHMPDELIVAVHRHHQEEFWSKHSAYSNLVLVANRMLKSLDIGDSVETEIPASTLELLALDEEILAEAFEDIKQESEALDMMAKQLVA